MQFWDEYAPILRIRNLKAEEGNKAFVRHVRGPTSSSSTPWPRWLPDGQKARRLNDSLDPFTTAAAMIAMIEHLLPYQESLQRRGEQATLQQTIAIILYQTLTGRDA